MRSILIVILIAIFLILSLPVALILNLIYRKNEKKAERGAYRCVSWVLKGIHFLAGIKLTVNGLENVPSDKPVLYIGNHRSFFDIVVTYPYFKFPTSYVAKEDLKGIPLFGLWGKLMGVLFFDRNNAKASVKMILKGISLLKTDTSVFVFPEGTRNKNKDQLPLLDFHDGTFKMASKSGAPVIPCAISHSMDVWEAHMPWVHKTRVTVTYGEPIYISDLEPEDQKHIGAFMKNKIESMLSLI